MAFPTAVNSQVTDSVTQANTKVLGDSPAIATAAREAMSGITSRRRAGRGTFTPNRS